MSKKPIRIQRKRTKGWRMPPNTVYVGRPNGWGNPFDWKQSSDAGPEAWRRAAAVDLYRESKCWEKLHPARLEYLRGKNLACWCPLDQPCHADVLLEAINGPMPKAKP